MLWNIILFCTFGNKLRVTWNVSCRAVAEFSALWRNRAVKTANDSSGPVQRAVAQEVVRLSLKLYEACLRIKLVTTQLQVLN